MNIKEAFEKLADSISTRSNYEASSKVSRALDVVYSAIHDVIYDLSELDEPASPHVTAEAEWRKGYEVLEQRVRDFQNDATRFRDELAQAKTECAVWKQAAINAQGPTLAADLQACRDAAEKLKAELCTMGERVAFQVERREWLEKELDAAKTAADVAIARAEAAEAKLLTPVECADIESTFQVARQAKPEYARAYGVEIAAVRRATRGS